MSYNRDSLGKKNDISIIQPQAVDKMDTDEFSSDNESETTTAPVMPLKVFFKVIQIQNIKYDMNIFLC